MRVGPTVRACTGGVGVCDDRLRQVRLRGLKESSNCESIVQVVRIKVGFLENSPSLDATVCKEVDQEGRDITRLSTREALGAQVAEGLVLGGAMRGGWDAPGYDQHHGRDGGGACGHTPGESSRR